MVLKLNARYGRLILPATCADQQSNDKLTFRLSKIVLIRPMQPPLSKL